MKDYYYSHEAWRPASLPCGAHGASSEVTFLCPAELAAELFPGVRVRWKWSSQWAGRRRFFTSETVLLVSPNRDSR